MSPREVFVRILYPARVLGALAIAIGVSLCPPGAHASVAPDATLPGIWPLAERTEPEPIPGQVRRSRRSGKLLPTIVRERPADDTVENHIERLDYQVVDKKDAFPEGPKKDVVPAKLWDNKIYGLTLLGQTGLIEVVAPDTLDRSHFQIGYMFINRSIQQGTIELSARTSFQSLNFGLVNRVEIGFGSSGYYKANNNTTYINGKVQLTNPLKHKKASLALIGRTFDFGSSAISNRTEYGAVGSLHLDKDHEIYVNGINYATNNFGNFAFNVGVLGRYWDRRKKPVILMAESVQDGNNNNSRFNFGVRVVPAEFGAIDVIVIKDITRNEFSLGVGGSLKF